MLTTKSRIILNFKTRVSASKNIFLILPGSRNKRHFFYIVVHFPSRSGLDFFPIRSGRDFFPICKICLLILHGIFVGSRFTFLPSLPSMSVPDVLAGSSSLIDSLLLYWSKFDKNSLLSLSKSFTS